MNIPYSEEAEKGVLGSVLIHPQKIYGIRSMLGVDDFYLVRNGYIWTALTRLAEREEAIDNVTVCKELMALGTLDAVGGPGYITQIIAETPTSVHVEVYAELVQRASMRRKLMVVADQIKALACDEARALPEVMGDISARVFNVVSSAKSRDRTWYEIISEYAGEVMDLWDDPTLISGLPTGMREYDAHTLGLHEGQLTVVAGRPGMGKTVLLMMWAVNMAQRGHTVGFWSGEMSEKQMAARAAAAWSGVDNHKLRTGAMTLEEKRRFMDAIGKLSELPIHFWEGEMRPGALKMKVLEAQARGGMDALFVDYIGLMQSDTRTENETQRVSEVSWGMKSIAMACKIPVVAASQLNRKVEERQDKRPQLHDLRASGTVEQDADVVIGLYREGAYDEAAMDPAKIEMTQLKYRHGEPRTFFGRFDGATSRISEAEVRRVRIE